MQRSADALSISLDIKVSDEINQLLSSLDFDNGYVYYQVTRADLIRSHMHSDQLETETFITLLNAHLKQKNLM